MIGEKNRRVEKLPKCIVIATRKLNGVMGGMEKQLLLISTYFVEQGHKVLIYSLDQVISKTFYAHDRRIEFRPLGVRDGDSRSTLWERIERQATVFRQLKADAPDAVFCFSTGALWYVALSARLQGIKVILTERTGPSVYFITRAKKFRSLIFAGMLLCSEMIVQMPAYVMRYPWYLRSRITIIPNEVPSLAREKSTSSAAIRFGHLGRFCYQKQTIELVQAFGEFQEKHPSAELLLIGSGEKLDEVQGLICENSLEEVVTVCPPTTDISGTLGRFDVLIHPSLWEGFPNSVAEALSAGIPVAGFEDCEGLRDLVEDGINGWIGKRNHQIDSITELLERVFDQRSLIPIMENAARESVRGFSREKVGVKWLELLESKA